MGTVGAGFSMSLDGFIAGPNDDMEHIFAWYFRGDTDVALTSGKREIPVKISAESAEQYKETMKAIGALVSGRRMFDVAGAWGGKHPLDVPIFVVTHHTETIAPEWFKEDMPFTFVTDGLASAIEQAQVVAGDKSVGVGGANITQQCIQLGLLDEIQIDLVPVLLGDGIRLFEHLGTDPIHLEHIGIIQGNGVTHLRFRSVK